MTQPPTPYQPPPGPQPAGPQSYSGSQPYGGPQSHGGQPHGGQPHGGPQLSPGLRRPPAVAYPPPVRLDAVPGTPYALAYLPSPPVTNGVGVGALVAGIGSLLVASLVWCLGLGGADGGWGAVVAGAFTALATLFGLAAVVLGIVGLRRVRTTRRSVGAVTGRGAAIAGIVCGGAGSALAVSGELLAVALG